MLFANCKKTLWYVTSEIGNEFTVTMIQQKSDCKISSEIFKMQELHYHWFMSYFHSMKNVSKILKTALFNV